MMLVQVQDRKVGPVVYLNASSGGVSVVVEAGEIVLDDLSFLVTLSNPTFLTSLPDDLLVVVSDTVSYAVTLDDTGVITTLDDDTLDLEISC